MDDIEESFQQQALEIQEPDSNFNPDMIPQNGEEYLTKMLYERRNCPAIVVRKLKNKNLIKTDLQKYDKKTVKSVSPPEILPTLEWKMEQYAEFEHVHQQVLIIRNELNVSNYKIDLEPPLTNDSKEWQKFCQENPPLLRTILRLNQRTLENLLEFAAQWLKPKENENITNDEEMPECSTQIANESNTITDISLERWLGTWLYAILACLHLPLEPNVHSTLRDIARHCINIRNRLQANEIEKAQPYNMFIYLISKFFNQADFAEFI